MPLMSTPLHLNGFTPPQINNGFYTQNKRSPPPNMTNGTKEVKGEGGLLKASNGEVANGAVKELEEPKESQKESES